VTTKTSREGTNGPAKATALDALTLLAVAGLWGASFLFIRVAVHELGPVALIEARVLLAGLALLFVVTALRRAPAWRRDWKGYVILGGLSAAAPFTLIAVAELKITASLAAILNATTPLFALILGAVRLHEPLTGRRVTGVLLGVVGVAVVVGLGPLRLDRGLLVATAVSLLAAFLYAVGGVYAKTRFPATAPITVATGQQLGAAALLLLPALALPPASAPTAGIAGAVLALALGSTALGFALFYRLVARLGPTGALSVTFLVPVFGLSWGALFLDERLTFATGAGLLIVLTAVALVTELGRPRPAFNALADPSQDTGQSPDTGTGGNR
jgi:drug/metabolite transporter (DMT)-like permease